MPESNFRIITNVGGVQGLHIALNVFTEDVEKRLFHDPTVYASEGLIDPDPINVKRRRNVGSLPMNWSRDVFSLSNLVVDSGLWPDYFTPDYCLGLTYPPGASFQSHFDSKHRWGESVVGVSLGQAGTMYFTPSSTDIVPTDIEDNFMNDSDLPAIRKELKPSNKFVVEVDLPRRSIYIMTGEARVSYKHGIRTQRPEMFAPPSNWNPLNYRRCLTMRHTKCYSDMYIERAIMLNPDNLSLLVRQIDQNQYVLKTEEGKVFKKKDLEDWKMYIGRMLDEMMFGRLSVKVESRFPLEETPQLYAHRIVYDLTDDCYDD